MNNRICAPQGQMCGKTFLFPARVYYEDTDAGGIVYYANYLKFAERARTEFLRSIGTTQSQSLEEEKCGFVVRHVEIDYLQPAKLDDLLTVTCETTECKGASALLYQEIRRDDEVLAKLKVQVVNLSISRMRPVRIPALIVDKLFGNP